MRTMMVMKVLLLVTAASLASATSTLSVNKGEDASDLIPTTNKGFLKRFARAENSAVMDLEEGNFKLAIDAFHATIVFFYMPNSVLCDNLHPQFERAAAILEKRGPLGGGGGKPGREVGFAKVNLNQKRVIAEHFNITHVPHLRVFPRGDTRGYRYNGYLGSYNEGARTGFALVNFAMRLMGYPLQPLDDDVDLRNAKKVWMRHAADMMVVGFFDNFEPGTAEAPNAVYPLVQAYIDAAHDNKNTSCFLSKSAVLASKFKVTPPALVLLKNFDERRNDIDAASFSLEGAGEEGFGAAAAAKITAWVAAHSFPRLHRYDANSRTAGKKVWRNPIWSSFMVLFRAASDRGGDGATASSEAAMQEACRAMGDKHNRGNVLCLDFPVDARQLASGMPLFYGVREADLPQVMLLHQERAPIDPASLSPEELAKLPPAERFDFDVTTMYKMAGAGTRPTVAALTAFSAAFEAGTLEKYYRTESAAVSSDGGETEEADEGSGFVPARLTGGTFAAQLEKLRGGGAESGLLVQLDESQIATACGGEAKMQPGCPTNYTAEHLAFRQLASSWPRSSLAFGVLDTFLNDLEYFAPGLLTAFAPAGGKKGADTLYGILMQRGPLYVLFPPAKDAKPLLYGGKIADADALKKFLSVAGAKAMEKDVKDEL
jgi:hypothetical protein